MSELTRILPYLLGSFFVIGIWVGGLVLFDVFTPSDVKAWRRLALLRGHALPKSRLERIAERTSLVSKLVESLDLQRLLAMTSRNQTPLSFLGSCFAWSLAAFALALMLDALPLATHGTWVVAPWLTLGVALVVFLLQISQLKRQARLLQANAGKALGDSLLLVAIMTDGRGLQAEDSVRILSHCTSTNELEQIVENRGYRNLVRQPHKSTVELYRLIASAYQIQPFADVADALANTNVGLGERNTFTRLAKTIYQQRLAEARQRAAKAKIYVTGPVALMLIPLLMLIGAPTFHTITQGIGVR